MSHTQIDKQQGNGQAILNRPDPEVVVKAQRRRFTAEYKHRILQDADACTHSGEIGALLRREGLYSSHLNTWRHHRARGELQGLTPAKRGRKADPQAVENARLVRETERLKVQLARAEFIIEVPKKVSQLFGLPEIPPDALK